VSDPTRPRSAPGWRLLAAFVFVAAGALFATSAHAARGTDLRAGRRGRLADLVQQEQRLVSERAAAAARLQSEVASQTSLAGGRSSRVADATRAGDELAGAAGLLPVTGPGLRVSLDDAPRLARGEERPGNPTPDDLVVHQQDVQAVVNGLWAGGAEAMAIMGKRVVATTSVQCVGNTLFLQDEVYSPPFVIEAIGDPRRLRASLDAEPGVDLFREAVAAWGLGYDVRTSSALTFPAYDGPLGLTHAAPRGPS
jgi:uncharacterized protein YlxW (UPF0749 family)